MLQTSPILEATLVNLIAPSAGDLLRRLKTIDIAVAPRTGRKKEQCEQYAICRFLSTYAETGLFQYPLCLEKRERPDCVVSLPSGRIGIEITEAVPFNWARVKAHYEERKLKNPVHCHHFLPGEPAKSKQKIDDIAYDADKGNGWLGDAPERKWAQAMFHFVSKKAESSKKPGYTSFDKNWLLIYDNWPLPAVRQEEAANYFIQQLGDHGHHLPFDLIFVERDDAIWSFNSLAHRTPVRDVWQES